MVLHTNIVVIASFATGQQQEGTRALTTELFQNLKVVHVVQSEGHY